MLIAADFPVLYRDFNAPVVDLDCGQKCAPYNGGVPYCCDTRHAVPTAYPAEWAYLKASTDLWHRWQNEDAAESESLFRDAGPDLVLIECLGHQHCQRDYRSLVCRAFPFFPYLNSAAEFLGLSYYWEYEDRCWVISNLGRVSPDYRVEFIRTYDRIFREMPQERENFCHYSSEMRRIFAEQRRAVPLLHRNGQAYKISPGSERMRRAAAAQFPKFGPYEIADVLLFPDEIS